VDDVVCAVPYREEGLIDEASKYSTVYEGSEHNVLLRYLNAALRHGADVVMRVTGDCPLISPELCGDVLAKLKGEGAEYASNLMPRTFPKGLDCEAFPMDVLQAAHITATSNEEREHVTPWMQRADLKRVNVASPWPLDGRLTLDTWDDYKTICAAFDHDADERLRPDGSSRTFIPPACGAWSGSKH